jgi:drug/metabolite transporter (DMT)-like permease
MNSGKSYKADLILLFITLIWAGTFSTIKNVLTEINPYVFIILRFLLAILFFTAIFNKHIKINEGKTLIHGGILGILYAIGYILQMVGLQYTSASKSAFITGTMVIFAPISQMFIEKKMISKLQMAGVLLAGVGLYLLSSPEGGIINLGDILTLFSAMVYGIYVVLTGKYSKVSNLNGLVFLQLLITIVFTLPFAAVYGSFNINYSSALILTIIYTGIFATVVTLYLQTKYQKESSPTRAAIIYTMEPLFAAFIAYYIFSEIIGHNVILGGGLIISGLLIAEFSETILKFKFERRKNE